MVKVQWLSKLLVRRLM